MLFRIYWAGLLLGLLGPLASHAQTPTDTVARQLDNQLRHLQVPPLVRVVQARAELVQALRTNQAARLPGLLDYLTHRLAAPDSVAHLSDEERALLLAVAGQFTSLLEQAVERPAYFGRNCRVPYRPFPADRLAEAAQYYLARHADSLVQAARQVPRPPADAAFLPLYLQVLASGRAGVSDSLSAGLRRFVQQHPVSRLAAVANQYVRRVVVQSPVTVGGELFMGGTFLQGGLGAAFTNTVRLGAGGEASWKRYLLYLRLATGSPTSRGTYTFGSATWQQEQELNLRQAELSLGYCVLETNRVRIMPFAGAGLLWLSPYKKNNQSIKPEADHTLWFTQPFLAGLNLEVKLDGPAMRRFGPGHLADEAPAIRIRNGWRPARALEGPPTAGGIYFFEIGFGMFTRLPGRWR